MNIQKLNIKQRLINSDDVMKSYKSTWHLRGEPSEEVDKDISKVKQGDASPPPKGYPRQFQRAAHVSMRKSNPATHFENL